MKKLALVLLVWLSTIGIAYSYNEGGHFYTLLALFDGPANSASDEQLKEIQLQVFCSELPDLAQELDAVTQRVHVLKNTHDFGWALFGRCQTKASSHMVASQYYLHGLSGAPADQIRDAAKAVIKAIDDDLEKQSIQSQERRNLICARGFAAHLYGDSFAHVTLSSEKPGFFSHATKREMYDTGMGHARDGHDPDYLYGHTIDIDKWPRWVQEGGNSIVLGADTAYVLSARSGQTFCNGDKIKNCEEPARRRLENLLHTKTRNMIGDMQNFLATGRKGVGDMERETSCNNMMEKEFPDTNNRPQCDKSWDIYLNKAIKVFYDKDIDPTSRSSADAGMSCSAWRCSGESSYNGSSPNSCINGIQIIDQLGFGVEP